MINRTKNVTLDASATKKCKSPCTCIRSSIQCANQFKTDRKTYFKPESKSIDAGWSSLVARRAHNPKVVGSNPAPATNSIKYATLLG